ncbi:MAG: 4Fe-4S binding protein [Desulfobacterales bacterium]
MSGFLFQRCTQCKRCTQECPFGALDDDAKGTPKPTRLMPPLRHLYGRVSGTDHRDLRITTSTVSVPWSKPLRYPSED